MSSEPRPAPNISIAWRQSPKTDSTRISFLDLPRELRDQIYMHALCPLGAIFLYTRSPYQPNPPLSSKISRRGALGPTSPQSVSSHISPALLCVSAQLHAEAAPVLYGANTFRLWLPGDLSLSPTYRSLVRHVLAPNEAAHLVLASRDLDAVSYGWKHRLWPRILSSAAQILAQFPAAEHVTVPLKPSSGDGAWRPAFFQLGGTTAVERVELAAEWMGERSLWGEGRERVREVLELELEAPVGRIGREEYVGSRFAPDEEEWDYSEFGAAFELMKVMY